MEAQWYPKQDREDDEQSPYLESLLKNISSRKYLSLSPSSLLLYHQPQNSSQNTPTSSKLSGSPTLSIYHSPKKLLPKAPSPSSMEKTLLKKIPPPFWKSLPAKKHPTLQPKETLLSSWPAPQQPTAFADSSLPGVNLWLAFKNTVLIPW